MKTVPRKMLRGPCHGTKNYEISAPKISVGCETTCTGRDLPRNTSKGSFRAQKDKISVIFNIFFLMTGLTWEADFWYSDYFFIVLKIYQRNLLKMIPASRYDSSKLRSEMQLCNNISESWDHFEQIPLINF